MNCEMCNSEEEELMCREAYKLGHAVEWVCRSCYKETYGLEWSDVPEEKKEKESL